MKSVNQNAEVPLHVWTEPDDGGKTVLGAIESAIYSVDISIYELGGPKILDSLLTAKKNGARIRIMFNAQFFVGNDPSNEKYSQQFAIKAALEAGEGEHKPELHWSCNNFNITHQKTIIIDARTDIGNDTLPETAKALVMTLNLSAYGWNMPGATCTSPCQFWGPGYPEKSPGTRDFGVVLTEADKVSKIQAIFDSDFGCSPANNTNGLRDSDDGLIWSNGTTGISPAKKGYYPKDGDYPYYDYEKLKEAEDQGNARKAHLYVIKQAQNTLLIYNEEMNDIELVDAIADAAKGGVDVKVVMTYDVKYGKNFDKIVDAGGEVRLFPDNNSWLYIHAKVLLADYGHETAVSFMGSQNISGNSLNFNRELGVILTGDSDNKLFYDTFFKDWEVKGITTWKVYSDNDSDESSYNKYNNGEKVTRKYTSPKSKSSQDETVYVPMTCGPLQVPTSVKKRGLFKKITVNQIHAMFRKKNKSEELDTSAFVIPIEEKAEDTPTKGAINFHINGESYSIKDPDPSLLLVDYLRSTEVGLTGTKHPCGQGGCGGCTVMLSYFDQHKESVVNVSINSCLRPVASLDGMEITTVEGLGSVDSEVSPVQYAIAKNNGSQCGYCTPGFVMNMHSLLIEKDGQELTKKQIEQAFDGNICRCTGFRPILYAMKTFATDWKPEDELGTMTCKVDPAEDVNHYKNLKGVNEEHLTKIPNEIKFEKDGQIWIRPTSMEALKATIIEHKETKEVKLVNGNTSHGIPNIIPVNPKVHIDIAHIKELKAIEVNSDGLVIGASTTYTEFLDLLERVIPKQNEVIQRGLNALHYMAIRTAGKIVRNVASLAGNTMLVARNINSGYPFPSDLFTAMSALETKIEVWHQEGTEKIETLEFLNRYSHDEYFAESVLIVAYHIPFTKEHDQVMNYKVALRKENSHSLANAGFKVTLDEKGFINAANLIVGGLTTHHKALTQTAEFLVGKAVNNKTLEEALKVLTLEVIQIFESIPQWFKDLPTEGVHNDYRLSLVQGYLYKFFIHLLKETNQPIEKDLASAPYVEFDRPVSKGKQTYSAYKDEYPVNVPFIKLSAFEQATGEAIYTHDIPIPVKGLQGAFVTSQSSFANFHYVIPKEDGRPSPCDKAEVLAHVQSKFPGVVDYFNYEDIPEGGKNGVVKSGVADPFFAEDEVTAFGQCIGLLVAETELDAINAAEYMTENCLAYSESKPILTMEEALEKGSFFTGYNPKTDDNQNITAPNSDLSWAIKTGVEGVEKRELEYGKTVLDNVPCLVVAGTQKTGAQIHFYMESQSCFTEPGEMKQMRVHPSSQSPNSVQGSVSSTLNVSTNNIQVDIKRLGGAYGGKTTRTPYVASPAAIASKKLKRPVRIAMPRKIDSLMVGHRHPFLGEFNVAIVPEGKHRGKMKGTLYEFYSNGGNTVDCSFDVMDCALLGADNSYNVDNFQAQGHVCKLNVTSNGAMRSYGSVQAGLITEEALEAAAHAIGMLPEDVREKNLYSMGDQTPFGQKLDYCIIKEVWHRLRETSEFDKRLKEVEKFNKNNKWKKRGISMIPMKYGLGYNLGFLMQGGALVDIYNHDGTVLVTHGGVEMGQGVMTKLAQIAAESLNIPLATIQMTGTHTSVVPNATGTGATSSTDLNGGAVKKACEIQRKKLEDACLQLLNKNGSEWCREQGINYWDHPKEGWKAVVTTKRGTGMIWNNVISQAYQNVVDLSSQALYQTPGLIESEDQQFYAYTYSACCSEVEIDVLTGESNVVRTDMCYDIGKSLNPAIDVGQIEGAFIMGVGYMLTENVVWEPKGTPNPAGQMNTPNTWTYKPPSAATIPIEFNVDLFPREEASNVPENPNLLMSSKGIGEPPLVLANSVFFAIKHAVLAARKDRGNDEWFIMDAPATVQEIRNKCLVNENDLTL